MNNTVFIIFEKSAIIRLGLIALLRDIENVTIQGNFRDTDNLISIVEEHKPDYIIINKIFVNDELLQTLNNYLKDNNIKSILLLQDKIQDNNSLWASQFFIDEEKVLITDKIEKLIAHNKKKKKNINETTEISKRERAVLAMVAQGYTNKEIAEKLFISTHTVITHRKNIVKKLGIKTVSGLTVYAILNKIIDMNDIK